MSECKKQKLDEGPVTTTSQTWSAQEASRIFFRTVANGSIFLADKRVTELEQQVAQLRKEVAHFKSFVPRCSWLPHAPNGSSECQHCNVPINCMHVIGEYDCYRDHEIGVVCCECEGMFCESDVHCCDNDMNIYC